MPFLPSQGKVREVPGWGASWDPPRVPSGICRVQVYLHPLVPGTALGCAQGWQGGSCRPLLTLGSSLPGSQLMISDRALLTPAALLLYRKHSECVCARHGSYGSLLCERDQKHL